MSEFTYMTYSERRKKKKARAKATFKELNRQLKEMKRLYVNTSIPRSSPVANNNVLVLDDDTPGTSSQAALKQTSSGSKKPAIKQKIANTGTQNRKSLKQLKQSRRNSISNRKLLTSRRVTRQSSRLAEKKVNVQITLEEGEIESDDDCVLVEPQPSLVVVSDDETIIEATIVATNNNNNNNNIKNQNNNAVTSTPCNAVAPTENAEMSLFFKDTSRIPWYDISKNLDGLTDLPSAELLSSTTKEQTKRKLSPEPVTESTINMSGIAELDKTVEEVSPAKKLKLNDEPASSSTSVVIELNETEEEETLKANQTPLSSIDTPINQEIDDSVIFVDETEKETNYIPFIKSSPDRINDTKKVSNNQLNNSQLFTRRERKELSKYNANAYNARSTVPESRKRFVIIDGSNVAFAHSGKKKEFSVRGLKICLDHFEKMGNKVKAVVPQHRFKKSRSSDWRLLEELKEKEKIIVTPCKNLPNQNSAAAYDDRFILQLAYEMDAAVVSNDNYRDLIFENISFKKIIENRVLSFAWCEDVFILAKDPYGRHGPTLDMILSC